MRLDNLVGRKFGNFESFAGYVTKLSSIAGRRRRDIELRLGFWPNALKAGYYLYALNGRIDANDFEWKDRTIYSDGWHYDRGIREYVQRGDEVRAQLGRQTNYNEQAVDGAISKIMEKHITALNVRTGPDRIVKVIPRAQVRGGPGF